MRADIYPLQVLLLTVAGWENRHQTDVSAYLVEENRVLKEQMKGRALRLTDDQRRRLAAKAKVLGRKALDSVATIVTQGHPDALAPPVDRTEVDLRSKARWPSRPDEGHRCPPWSHGPRELDKSPTSSEMSV